jgi:hypothetical protein
MTFHVDRDLPAALEFAQPGRSLPTDSWGLRLRALFAAGRHHFKEAATILEHALGQDPYSPWIGAALAWVHHLAGRADESLHQIRRCLEMAPLHPASSLYGGMILAFHGETKQAVDLTSELTRHAPQFDMALAVHAYALARHGDRARAEECLESLQWLTRERYGMRSFSAAAYLALDDADSALAELTAANESRCPWFFQMIGDPRLQGLRHRVKFQQFLAIVEQMEAGVSGEAGPTTRCCRRSPLSKPIKLVSYTQFRVEFSSLPLRVPAARRDAAEWPVFPAGVQTEPAAAVRPCRKGWISDAVSPLALCFARLACPVHRNRTRPAGAAGSTLDEHQPLSSGTRPRARQQDDPGGESRAA